MGLLGDILSPLASGLSIIGSFASAGTDASNRILAAEAQKSQALSDQQIAIANMGILQVQRSMFETQQEEIMGDISEKGAEAQADRQALAAASGMGGAGTAATQYSQTERRIERDVGRVQSYMQEQSKIFGLQISQAQEQADEFGDQATFADKARKKAKKAKKTWWNPFD